MVRRVGGCKALLLIARLLGIVLEPLVITIFSYFQVLIQSNYSFGFSDLPEDLPDDPPSSGLQVEAIVAEIDEDTNPLILQSKKICSKDQIDYCAGSPYKSPSHTMCKYCVSIQ
jgi:hypothetical protein